jgi:membrane protein
VRERLDRLAGFFREGVWTLRLEHARAGTKFLIRSMRVFGLAVQGFLRNGCARSAAYLTYYSLLNIVPLLAVAFAVAKGFGLEKLIQNRIVQLAQEANWQAEATDQLLRFSQSLLQQTKGGLIAGVGVILLLYTVISILGRIEETLNTTWDVKRARTFARKIGDYLTLMMVGPILFITSSSITILVASKLKDLIRDYSILGPFSAVILLFMKAFSYLSIWLLLMVLYVLMPNTKVRPHSAFIGGVVAGTAYLMLQWVYIKFQIGVASYGAIYGSFAALPLLLVWLQWSWMIVLFGAEIAHACEHHETYGFHPDYSIMGSAVKKALVVRVFHSIVQAFSGDEKALTASQISLRLEIPLRLVQHLLSELIDAGLVAKVDKPGSKAPAFQPARSVEDMTIKNVLDIYEGSGQGPLETKSEHAQRIAGYLRDIGQAAEQSAGNIKLKEL